MSDSKLVFALKFAEKLSRKRNDLKKDFQEFSSVLLAAVDELEGMVEGHINNIQRARIKLCLIQLRYTINKMSQLLSKSTFTKKTTIVKLLNKKIYLCLKEAFNVFNGEEVSTPIVSQEANYHFLMSEILSALSSSNPLINMNDLVDNLLCSCLTIAKLSINNDFKEINASCKNILDLFTSLKDQTGDKGNENSFSIDIVYHIKLLERKVNSAMLRLFLHIMCYPQASLKRLIKKSGAPCKSEKFSEDLDDEISEFDLACDRIALIGNFAIKSCEQETLRLKVQNSLANLEFIEESLVPACIDFYLEPNKEKREFLKYLSAEWKSEVLLLNTLLDSIVDPAAFSLVVLEDLFEVVQKLKAADQDQKEKLFQEVYQKCFKLIANIFKSSDCVSDSFLINLKNSLLSALKKNDNYNTEQNKSVNRVQHLEVILSLVDQISEHLNKILNNSIATKSWSISFSTVNDASCNDSMDNQSRFNSQNITLISKEWENRCKGKESLLYCNKDDCVPNRYLEKAQLCSPFVFTMYQKTPVKKKFKDNLALTLDFSKQQIGIGLED